MVFNKPPKISQLSPLKIKNIITYQLKSFYVFLFLVTHNLRFDIPLTEKKTIVPNSGGMIWQLNPSIARVGGKTFLAWRETNGVFRSKSNLSGQMTPERLGEGVVNKIFIGELADDGGVENIKMVSDSNSGSSLEDPRLFVVGESLWLVATKLKRLNNASKVKWTSTVSVVSIESNREIDLISPRNKNIEKNWVPITAERKNVLFLYESNPQTILFLDLKTGQQATISEAPIKKIPKLNGGSQFIKMPDGNFLRVARRRVPFFNRGYVHISFLVLHDPSFKPLRISSPFVFNKIGIEICNGLSLDNSGNLLFSWCEEDRNMFLAKADSRKLMNWFFNNSIKVPL